MKYIIKIIFSPWVSDFVGNGSYIVHGEKYVVLTDYKSTKRYSSKKIAENAIKKMIGTYANVSSNYKIMKVEE